MAKVVMETTMKCTPFVAVWKIRNFKKCFRNSMFLLSNSFYLPMNDGNEWYLHIKTWRDAEDEPSPENRYLSLMVNSNMPAKMKKMEINITCCLIDASGNKIQECCNYDYKLINNGIDTRNFSAQFRDFILIGELFKRSEQLLPNDVLTIHCEMVVLQSSETITVKDVEPVKKESGTLEIGSSPYLPMGELLYRDKNKNGDIILRATGGREIKAHKCILTTASPVFESLFENDTQETGDNRTNLIKDVEPEVLEEMLRFIYTGKTPKLENKMAAKLFEVSIKCELLDLRGICEHHLVSNLTVGEAPIVLSFAHKHSADGMKKRAAEFIAGNYKEVSKTGEWLSVVENNPRLVISTINPLLFKL